MYNQWECHETGVCVLSMWQGYASRANPPSLNPVLVWVDAREATFAILQCRFEIKKMSEKNLNESREQEWKTD